MILFLVQHFLVCLFIFAFPLRFGLGYLEDFLLIDAFSFFSSTMILPRLFFLKLFLAFLS